MSERAFTLQILNGVFQLEPEELHRLISEKTPITLLDVREPEEHALASFQRAKLIPLMELPERLDEIRQLVQKKGGPLVLYCRSGIRSQNAGEWLIAQGMSDVYHLRGGINAYAKNVKRTRLTAY